MFTIKIRTVSYFIIGKITNNFQGNGFSRRHIFPNMTSLPAERIVEIGKPAYAFHIFLFKTRCFVHLGGEIIDNALSMP